MYFIKNVDLVGRSERERVDALGECANIFHTIIARGVNLIEVILGTTDRGREDARNRRLPEPAASSK